MKPKRVQRKRTKGLRMPPNTVYVGRGSRWGNPYRVGHEATSKQHAKELFVESVRQPHNQRFVDEIKRELRGKDLSCWCYLDDPCHGDVLLEVANQEMPEKTDS